MKESSLEQSQETFDHYANEYDAALEMGISVSGEDKDFFAKARVEFLARRVQKFHFEPRKILDFGCGTGASIPFLLQVFPEACIVGVELSSKSLAIAENLHKSDRVDFALAGDPWHDGSFDMAFCNGVFHHIPTGLRQAALENIRGALKKDGVFAFWENNPWNPGTRIVMSRIPFDRDAETISPIAARKLLSHCGFDILKCSSAFYFPRFLSLLRPLEKFLMNIPFGAQYLILGRKAAINVS
jgi:SAM-dependent methyltransferase